MKRRLTLWRRRWCLWRGHPMADWSPVVMRTRDHDRLAPDGTIIEGDEFVQRSWRCALHDALGGR